MRLVPRTHRTRPPVRVNWPAAIALAFILGFWAALGCAIMLALN